MITFYLRSFLGKEYQVLIEFKKAKTRPDILVKKEGIFISAIEIKTTIGWNRGGLNSFKKRIEEISNVFGIKKKNIYYVFESPKNVSKEFEQIFWDKENKKPKKSPTEEPYNHIRPLFYETADPYYWRLIKDGKKRRFSLNDSIKLSKEEIIEKTKQNIVRKIEDMFIEIKSL